MIRRVVATSAATALCFGVASCSSSSGADQHGAEQFAGYWIATLNKATVTGNTTKLKALSADTCTRCAEMAKQLKDIYGAGGHVETNGWQVQTMVPEAGLPEGTAGMKIVVNVTPQQVYPSKGAQVEAHKGGELTFRMLLTRQGDHWLAKSVDL